MENIKIYFTDFSQDFVIKEDFFFKVLSKHYNLILDSDNPDYLIYSCYGFDYLSYDCVRIFYTAENIRPDFNLCDYGIGFDYLNFEERYIRFPNFARYGAQFENIVNQEPLTVSQLQNKSGFCNFIYSNPFADPSRDQFFYLLSKYKQVDSAGRHLNNMSAMVGDRYAVGWRESKVDFQGNYKFTVAFENSSAPGYTTEKIMHAFAAKTIPIYWGNPDVVRDFNPKAFVNCHDYVDFDQVVERIVQVDCDNDLYMQMVNEPCFVGGVIPFQLSEQAILGFFRSIFLQTLENARRRPRYGTTSMYERDARLLARTVKRRQAYYKVRQKVCKLARFLKVVR